MRVHELAKDLNISSKELIDVLAKQNLGEKKVMSGLDSAEVTAARDYFKKPPQAPQPTSNVAPPQMPIDAPKIKETSTITTQSQPQTEKQTRQSAQSTQSVQSQTTVSTGERREKPKTYHSDRKQWQKPSGSQNRPQSQGTYNKAQRPEGQRPTSQGQTGANRPQRPQGQGYTNRPQGQGYTNRPQGQGSRPHS